jgi:hypothetical protein
MPIKRTDRGISAWLITWESMGNHVETPNKIAVILDPRMKPDRVKTIIELLYVNEEYSLSDRISYAKSKRNNPYPAEYDAIGGVKWQGRITCGHNPWLEARLVDNLKVRLDDNGEEQIIWVDRKPPDFKKIYEELGWKKNV